jgi:hypothetical protein
MIRSACLIALLTLTPVAVSAQTRPVPRPDPSAAPSAAVPVETAPVADGRRAEIAAAIQQGVAACWNISGLSEAALATQIVVAVEMDPSGRALPDTIGLASFSGGEQAAANEIFATVRRAIMRCSGERLELDPAEYPAWQSLALRFVTPGRSAP